MPIPIATKIKNVIEHSGSAQKSGVQERILALEIFYYPEASEKLGVFFQHILTNYR